MSLLRALLPAILVLLAPFAGAADLQLCALLDPCLPDADGGAPGDASDSCGSPSPEVRPAVPALGRLGPHDPEDDYALVVQSLPPTLVVRIENAPPLPAIQSRQHRLDVWAPSGTTACATFVGSAWPQEPLSFSPAVTGTYTLRVVLAGPLADRHLLELPNASCHLMCLAQNVTGYAIAVVTGG